MKKSTKTNIIAVCTLSVISLLSINVSALDYQKTINVGFNVQDTLTVSLSSPNLIIDDLMPGTASDSNIITVNVLSNNPYGYTLTSNVGNNTTYNTDKLIHASSATATPFSTITAGTTVTDLNSFTNYQWGYSYSTDNGASWITDGGGAGYSGLPLYGVGEATLLEKSSTSAATGDNIQFKIAAKAADTQLAGEYKNVVNFAVVGGSAPAYYMQDVGTWGSSLAEGSEITAIDSRDNKQYTVAKLADGNIWMTQNLDHDIVTTAGYYTPSNTDISSAWTPSTATYATGTTTWDYSYTAPESYDPGDLCWNGEFDSSYSGTLDTYAEACGSDKHYSIGNYYNWTAAVAMNDSSSYATDQQDVNQSICPAGWRLPTYSGSKSYDTLVSTLNLTAGTTGNIHQSPVYFPYAGYWFGGSGSVGGFSDYWSSVVVDGRYSYDLYFDAYGSLNPHSGDNRSYSYSVRCVAR